MKRINMKLTIGMELISKDVHGDLVHGKIEKILSNTVIIKKDTEYFLIRKSELHQLNSYTREM